MSIAARERRWLELIERDDEAVDVDWYKVGDLWWSSAVKIDGFRIAMTYRRSVEAAALLGGRLPTQAEAVDMFRAADHVEPVIIRPVSSSIAAIQKHSRGVDNAMGQRRRLVDNEGKLWLAGAPSGKAVNFGWPSTAAPHLIAPGMRGWQPAGTAHNDLHVDYSQTLRVVMGSSPHDGRREENLQPWKDPSISLGERAVEFSLHELRLGNLETTGRNSGPRIAEYFAPAVRNGKPLGLKSGDWCVAGLCFATQQSLLEGEQMPHPYRVSGIELQRDANAAGTWVTAEYALANPAAVKRGDLCILPRGKPGGWQRHGCRVLQQDGDQLRTIGANEGTSWRITERRTSDALGFVIYPRLAVSKSQDDAFHADAMKRAQKAAHDAAKRRIQADGMDEVVRLQGLIAELGEELVG